MKIVVVGGGTAGWLAALMISKVFKGIHSVTLVESKSIGTIGVGEGSTGFLRGVLNNEVWDYGCNELDFMRHANATPKLGILFKEWAELGKEYMEPIDAPKNKDILSSYPLLSHLVAHDQDISMSSINGRFMSQGISSFCTENGSLRGNGHHAYHFDAKLAAGYFEKVCGSDVAKITTEVLDFDLNSNGDVIQLITKDAGNIKGDFFIDASGFSRLFAKKMSVDFVGYPELTLDSAIPFRIESEVFGDPFFYTVSWAQKYGWMWMIPKSDFIGAGYIYDSNYIDAEGAQKEIEEKLGFEIYPIKNIKFKAGRLKTAWNRNVLSVGLSSNFLEPLEATSIHGTIAQLNNFIYKFLKNTYEDTVTEENILHYNKQTSGMIDNFRDFILYHYAKTRSDTPFWEAMNKNALENPIVKDVLEVTKHKFLSQGDIPYFYGASGVELFNWVAAGLNHLSKEEAEKEIKKLNRSLIAKEEEFSINDYLLSKPWLSNAEFLKILGV